ncbi:MAG: hypothetical protein EU548_04690 [Promethearchaeota archaeon]|nr:MAG: hypothetical protein EU548_04690 [Candidatus Lokiarchaeota archaeon]
MISFTLKDNLNRTVPYGRVHLRASDGKYYTAYADVEGKVKFRLPPQSNEMYNVTITGHNVIPSNFNFTTLKDSNLPVLLDLEYNPAKITVDDNPLFSFSSQDTHSGIESIFLVLSKNSFQDFFFYQVKNNFDQNFENFNITLNKLKPGEYSYAIIVRDYTNTTSIYHGSSYFFIIEIPITYYIFIVSFIFILSMTAFTIFYTIYKLKPSKEHNRKIKPESPT